MIFEGLFHLVLAMLCTLPFLSSLSTLDSILSAVEAMAFSCLMANFEEVEICITLINNLCTLIRIRNECTVVLRKLISNLYQYIKFETELLSYILL